MITVLKDRLLQYVLDLKFKKKLFISYLFLIIIPLLAFTFVSYNQISQIIQKNMIYSARQSFDQAVYFLSTRVNSAMNISDLIILDTEAVKVFENMAKPYELPQQMLDFNNLKKSLVNLQRNKDIFRVRIFIPSDLMFSGDKENFFSIDTVKEENWYNELKNSSVTVLWHPTTCLTIDKTGGFINDRVLSALRIVKSPLDFSKDVGILSIDILESDIHSIIKNSAGISKTGIVYLEDGNGVIQSSSTTENTNRWRIKEDYFEASKEGDWKTTSINSEEAIVGYKTIGKTGWRLVSVIPLKDILSSSINQRNTLMILLVIISGIAYFIAYFISKTSTKRIYRLTDSMKKAQSGDFNIAIANRSKDEIGELTEDFNYLIKEIRDLIAKQVKIGQEVKNAELRIVEEELKTLQAQINPHFLYNTLDTIYWLSIKYNCQDIERLILLLSRFYKLSLSKGRDIVTIEDELIHVQTFVEISNIRFGNILKLELDMEEFKKYKLPKITFQPLVENSIIHGIQKKPVRSGTVRISGFLENGIVTINIQDDGVGMAEDQVQKIFSENNGDTLHGFGIRNINERLKLYFGSQYGLAYKSVPGSGTIAEIRIPPLE